MKKYILALAVLMLSTPVFARTSNAGNGLCIATKAQETNSGHTLGDGDLYVYDDAIFGDSNNPGTVTFNGTVINGAQSVSRATASAGTTISPTNALIAITVTSPDGGVVCTATPHFSTTTVTNYSSFRLILLSTNPFTIQDNDTLAGSLVELSSATQYTFTQYKFMDLFYYNGKYYQVDPMGMATDNITISGTMQSGTATAGTVNVSTLLNVDEDVDIDFDAFDEEMSVATSSGTNPLLTLQNTNANPEAGTALLKGIYTANGDAQGQFIQFYDNNTTNDLVFQVGPDGVVTIDASGGGSGTVLSEATLVANDAAFRIDSETQDLQIGDGTNNTVVSDNGVISQTGDAQASLLDVTIAGTGISINSFVTVADSDTVTASSNTFILASKAGASQITLPAVATATGKIFTIKKTGTAGIVTIAGAGAENIDGANTYTAVDAQYDFVTIICDGTSWHIVGSWIQ